MPIQSALDKLAHESDAITVQSRANMRGPGPFTSTYLYLQGGDIFNLVRDATEPEKRPFGTLVPSSLSSASLPKARLRVSSPLRKFAMSRGTRNELPAALAAAEEVIDTMAAEHSMARARRETEGFAAQHEANRLRVAELEAKLQDAIHSPKKVKEKTVEKERNVDEAIAAEEEALRALEESLAPLRRKVAEQKAAVRSPARSPRSPTSPKVSKISKASPSPLNKSVKLSTSPLQTPKPLPKPVRPGLSPNSPKASTSKASTSLRASTSRTPARQLLETPHADITRFSPLTLVATPRTRLGVSGSTIVSRMRASITPAPRSAYRSSVLSRSTARIPSPVPEPSLVPDTTPKAKLSPAKRPTKASSTKTSPARAPPVKASPAKASPAKASPARPTPKSTSKPAPKKKPPKEPVIDMSLASVAAATALIRSALPPEIWRMLPTEPASDQGGTIAHLEALAVASLPAPPSPSSSEVPSTTSTAADAPPVTRDAVLAAHLCLGMLRRLGPGAVDDKSNHVPEAVLKAELGAVASARGWDGVETLTNSVIYQARGQKLLGTVWRDRKVHFRK
ncbi:hypothetical protein CspeluHIS016_0103030 [Cutaneotrichosporon spelunceum]|uniref:Uncharacterized protein n=1 Tax=Cutaneotrichosporon spelunceum TaxID=1672016 RepID=A0AAD3TNA6_9TREE|nr:hypothetical protein CspeluHIS016_0103030 [Cutaneotrichosporon spelunceum]